MYSLFGSDGCHLCDQAYQLVEQLQQTAIVTQVDIVEQQELVQRYGVRIPVLLCHQTEQELGWPFTIEQLAEFFQR